MSTANQITLDAANKVFKAAFAEELSLQGEGEIINAAAMKTRSKAKVVEYDWLNSFDELRVWLGEREISNMAVESYTLASIKYESSMVVDRVDAESDALGLYAPKVGSMVGGYFRKRRSLMASLFTNGATTGNNSYDGVTFFNATHPSDGEGAAQSNLSTSTALTGANFDATVQKMEQLKDHRGQPMDIQPDTLVISPALRAAARNLFQLQTAYATDFAGDNPWFGAIKIIVEPYLTGTTWYLLDTKKSLKPFILQDADNLELSTLQSVNDEFVIMNDAFFYGTRSRFGLGYGLWQLAHRCVA